MGDVRTTISFESELYRTLKTGYRELGFATVGDLVNEAVRQFLRQRQLQEKHHSMERAASDPGYRQLLREISDDWAAVDAQGPDY